MVDKPFHIGMEEETLRRMANLSSTLSRPEEEEEEPEEAEETEEQEE